MTVAELIAELQKYPDEAVIMTLRNATEYKPLLYPATYVVEMVSSSLSRGNVAELHTGGVFPVNGFVVLRR